MMNAQGEDVVAGIRTPEPLSAMNRWNDRVAKELGRIRVKLEKHYKDMQDIEFTVENGKLFMLQTRTGKRTAASALRIAVEMEKERLIDKKTAVLRVTPEQVNQLMHPQIDPKADKILLATGLPASPGAASGVIVIDPPPGLLDEA